MTEPHSPNASFSITEHFTILLAEMELRHEQRFTAQQTAVHAALSATEKAGVAALEATERAVAKAEVAAEKRFDSVNEFRKQLADQAATFMPRSEAETRLHALSLDYLQRFDAAREANTVALTVSEKAILKAEVATDKRLESFNEFRAQVMDQAKNYLLRPEHDANVERFRDLVSRMDKSEGTSAGKIAFLGYLFGVMTLLSVVVNVIALVYKK
jgi:hypothetical protein